MLAADVSDPSTAAGHRDSRRGRRSEKAQRRRPEHRGGPLDPLQSVHFGPTSLPIHPRGGRGTSFCIERGGRRGKCPGHDAIRAMAEPQSSHTTQASPQHSHTARESPGDQHTGHRRARRAARRSALETLPPPFPATSVRSSTIRPLSLCSVGEMTERYGGGRFAWWMVTARARRRRAADVDEHQDQRLSAGPPRRRVLPIRTPPDGARAVAQRDEAGRHRGVLPAINQARQSPHREAPRELDRESGTGGRRSVSPSAPRRSVRPIRSSGADHDRPETVVAPFRTISDHGTSSAKRPEAAMRRASSRLASSER